MISNSIPRYISKRIESSDTNRYLYTHIHSTIIHYGQKVKTTQVFINRSMDKENMVYTHNGILFGFKINEILIPAVTWMDLENIMLDKIS